MKVNNIGAAVVSLNIPDGTQHVIPPGGYAIVPDMWKVFVANLAARLNLLVDDGKNVATGAVADSQYLSTLLDFSVVFAGTSGTVCTATGLIPVGALVTGVVVKVITTLVGPTSLAIGDGTTADLWGTGVSPHAGTVTSSANFQSGATPRYMPAGGNVVLISTGGDFSGTGKIKITVYYATIAAVVAVADAGPDQLEVPVGAVVSLNGSGSSHALNEPLTYLWAFTQVPTDSNGQSTAAFHDTTSVMPTFVADLPGEYDVTLTVTDLDGCAVTDTMIVLAI